MRILRNEAEQAFNSLAISRGWEVTKKGYPDFICYKNDEMMMVEVKKKSTHRLKKDQLKFMNEMKKRGVRCYKWALNGKWVPY